MCTLRWSYQFVATTSTKPPAVLKVDIRRVLECMQMQYKEMEIGLVCVHLPSIDISSLRDSNRTPTSSPRKHRKQCSGSDDSDSEKTR
jgi:hypothetical protein